MRRVEDSVVDEGLRLCDGQRCACTATSAVEQRIVSTVQVQTATHEQTMKLIASNKLLTSSQAVQEEQSRPSRDRREWSAT